MNIKPEVLLSLKKDIGFNKILITGTDESLIAHIKNFIIESGLYGIDRVVPFGQALNINLIWDGYDLTKILTREIEIK